MFLNSEEIVQQVRAEFEATVAFVLDPCSSAPRADAVERSLLRRLLGLGRSLLPLSFVHQASPHAAPSVPDKQEGVVATIPPHHPLAHTRPQASRISRAAPCPIPARKDAPTPRSLGGSTFVLIGDLRQWAQQPTCKPPRKRPCFRWRPITNATSPTCAMAPPWRRGGRSPPE